MKFPDTQWHFHVGLRRALKQARRLIQRSDDGSQVEMAQTLNDKDQDRRLGRARRLGEEELNDLRMDLATFMSKLPDKFQDLLRRRQSQSITEISRDLGVPRTTLNDWMLQVRKLFEEAGFERYLES